MFYLYFTTTKHLNLVAIQQFRQGKKFKNLVEPKWYDNSANKYE